MSQLKGALELTNNQRSDWILTRRREYSRQCDGRNCPLATPIICGRARTPPKFGSKSRSRVTWPIGIVILHHVFCIYFQCDLYLSLKHSCKGTPCCKERFVLNASETKQSPHLDNHYEGNPLHDFSAKRVLPLHGFAR